MNVLVSVMHFIDVNMLLPVEMQFIICHFSFLQMFMETIKQAATNLQGLDLWFNSVSPTSLLKTLQAFTLILDCQATDDTPRVFTHSAVHLVYHMRTVRNTNSLVRNLVNIFLLN